MKFYSNIFRFCIVIALTFNVLNANAQLKIQYYEVVNLQSPNNSVVSINETPSGDLLLLCENSDGKYKNQKVKIIKTTAKGDFTKQELKEIKNLESLVKLVSLKENQWSVFGNIEVDGTINPTISQIDSHLLISDEKNEANSLSSKLNDVCKNLEGNLLQVYTKIGKSGKHNIELKQSSKDGTVNWLKAISSENNEEATMMRINEHNEIFILGKKYNDELTQYVPIMYKVDSKGNNLWKKGIESTGEFYDQFFSIKNNGNIMYACSYTKNQTGTSETKIVELSNEGMEINQNTLTDFTANGITCIDLNQSILYGSEFSMDNKQVFTKAKYVIVNNKLEAIETRALNKKDKPDVDLQKKINTSSEYIALKTLKNGDIALGGKVYMPIATSPNERSNHALLVIVSRAQE